MDYSDLFDVSDDDRVSVITKTELASEFAQTVAETDKFGGWSTVETREVFERIRYEEDELFAALYHVIPNARDFGLDAAKECRRCFELVISSPTTGLSFGQRNFLNAVNWQQIADFFDC